MDTTINNSFADWLIAIVLIIGSILFAKLIYVFLEKVLKKITERTESKLDDILVDLLKEPLVFGLIILGIWYALQTLTFHKDTTNFIATIYYFLILFDIAWFIVRIIDSIIERYIIPFTKETPTKLDDQLLPILRKGIKASIWIIASLVALKNAGYDVGAILASLGIGGLAFALAAKDTVANLFGGITIFFDEPFQVNDRIIVDGYDGYVEEVGLRSTRLRLLNGRIITISNSSMTNSSIENISSEESRKVKVILGLTYSTSEAQMQKAMDILQEIAKENSALEEKAVTAFISFGDFSLNLKFIYYIKKGNPFFETQSNVNMKILQRFNQEKLNFAFPTQDINLYKQD